MGRHLPQFVILHQLNRHVAKGLVRKIPGDVSKVPSRKSCVAFREPDFHRWLALDFIRDVSVAEGDVDIIVPMAMHERRSMGCNLNLEDPNKFVLQGDVVRGFRGDFDFTGGLRGQ